MKEEVKTGFKKHQTGEIDYELLNQEMMAKYGAGDEKTMLLQSSSEDQDDNPDTAPQDFGTRQARIDELCKSSDDEESQGSKHSNGAEFYELFHEVSTPEISENQSNGRQPKQGKKQTFAEKYDKVISEESKVRDKMSKSSFADRNRQSLRNLGFDIDKALENATTEVALQQPGSNISSDPPELQYL